MGIFNLHTQAEGKIFDNDISQKQTQYKHIDLSICLYQGAIFHLSHFTR